MGPSSQGCGEDKMCPHTMQSTNHYRGGQSPGPGVAVRQKLEQRARKRFASPGERQMHGEELRQVRTVP